MLKVHFFRGCLQRAARQSLSPCTRTVPRPRGRVLEALPWAASGLLPFHALGGFVSLRMLPLGLPLWQQLVLGCGLAGR